MKFFCNDCGKLTIHTKRGSAKEAEDIDLDSGGKFSIEWETLFLQCNGCESVSLQLYGEPFDGPQQLYPYEKNLSEVPEQIQKAYKSAKKIRSISPDGFCVLIRRALEAIVDDRGASGNNLFEKIDNLSKREIIPETLLKMSHQIRYLGNAGAHLGKYEPDIQDARVMDEFFLAVAEYVYIAPEKLKRVEERMKGEKSKNK